MFITVYSTIVLGQAQTYSSDLKMAHYVSTGLYMHRVSIKLI